MKPLGENTDDLDDLNPGRISESQDLKINQRNKVTLNKKFHITGEVMLKDKSDTTSQMLHELYIQNI